MVSFFFLFRCGSQEKILKKLFNLNSTQRWGTQCPSTQDTLIIFLSAITVMQMIFWTEDNFWFASDCRNSFNCKLKKLVNEQIIIFYSPSNTLCSSDKSVHIKHFNHHTFIIPFPLGSICKYWISVNKDTTSLKQID